MMLELISDSLFIVFCVASFRYALDNKKYEKMYKQFIMDTTKKD